MWKTKFMVVEGRWESLGPEDEGRELPLGKTKVARNENAQGGLGGASKRMLEASKCRS